MKFNISRKRRFFGRETQFSDHSFADNKELYTEVTPVATGSTEDTIVDIKRLELERGTQVEEGGREREGEREREVNIHVHTFQIISFS